MMKEWVLICNSSYFDLKKAFAEQRIISWPQDIPVKVGDNVYFYVSNPYSEILYKGEVQEINLQSMDTVSEDYVMHACFYVGAQKYMRIKKIRQYSDNCLTEEKLHNAGIKNLQASFKVDDRLAELLNEKDKKKESERKTGNTATKKLILVCAGALLLLIVGVLGAFFSAGKSNNHTGKETGEISKSIIEKSEKSESSVFSNVSRENSILEENSSLSVTDFNGTAWSGYYDAISDGEVIKRYMDMYIGDIDKDGYFNGVTIVTNNEREDSFMVSGKINYATGEIYIVRDKCLSDNSQKLNPIRYVGTIDQSSIVGVVQGEERKIELLKSDAQLSALKETWDLVE